MRYTFLFAMGLCIVSEDEKNNIVPPSRNIIDGKNDKVSYNETVVLCQVKHYFGCMLY